MKVKVALLLEFINTIIILSVYHAQWHHERIYTVLYDWVKFYADIYIMILYKVERMLNFKIYAYSLYDSPNCMLFYYLHVESACRWKKKFSKKSKFSSYFKL